jgi:hypothetical protein
MAKKTTVTTFNALGEVEYLRAMVDACMTDAEKFDAGNKAAGTRLRAQFKSIKDKAFSLRKEVIEARKARG